MATPQIVCKKLVEGFALSERSNPGDIVVMRKVIKYWQPDNESEEFEVSLRELSRKLCTVIPSCKVPDNISFVL